MAYKTDYLIPKRILLNYLYGTMDKGDFERLREDSFRLMDLGTAPIHVLSIMDPQIQYARNLQTIVAMMKGTDELHPHSGWIVQVTQQSLHRFVSTWTIQLVYKNVRFHPVDTLNTALQFLKDRDVTLAALDVDAVLADYAAWKPILHNAEF